MLLHDAVQQDDGQRRDYQTGKRQVVVHVELALEVVLEQRQRPHCIGTVQAEQGQHVVVPDRQTLADNHGGQDGLHQRQDDPVEGLQGGSAVNVGGLLQRHRNAGQIAHIQEHAFTGGMRQIQKHHAGGVHHVQRAQQLYQRHHAHLEGQEDAQQEEEVQSFEQAAVVRHAAGQGEGHGRHDQQFQHQRQHGDVQRIAVGIPQRGILQHRFIVAEIQRLGQGKEAVGAFTRGLEGGDHRNIQRKQDDQRADDQDEVRQRIHSVFAFSHLLHLLPVGILDLDKGDHGDDEAGDHGLGDGIAEAVALPGVLPDQDGDGGGSAARATLGHGVDVIEARQMDKRQMSDFLDWVKQFAAENLYVYIEDPKTL